MTQPEQLSRRSFMSGAGALIVCVAGSPQSASSQARPRSLAPNPDLDTWLRIERDGRVHVFTGKCELGQGIKTAVAQIVAEELDVQLGRLIVETVDTAHSPNEGGTVGSNSIPDGGTALRLAAAEARSILLGNASRDLQAPIDMLSVRDGIVIAPSGESTSYGELLSGGRFDAQITGEAPIKNADDHGIVGRPVERIDLPAKCYGEPAFIHDLVLPGMLHARVVRSDISPSRLLTNAVLPKLESPRVFEVVRDGHFVAVVAERDEDAIAAAAELRGKLAWQAGPPLRAAADRADVLRTLRSEDSVINERRGDERQSVDSFTADYSRPFIAHASLGPSAALAQWDGRELIVYSHAQGMYPLRGALARVTGLPVERIRCIHKDGAGCYGQNGADDAACDAALIAMALEGRPIRLVWSRHDEFRHEPYGSAMSIQLSAGVDSDGTIVDWQHDVWSQTHRSRPSGDASAGWLLGAREKATPLPEPPISDIGQPAGGADRNAVPLYTIANQRIVEHLIVEPTLHTSALRSLGAHANVFAIESFINEIANSVGADPIEYRLRHLDDSRARTVIERARGLAARSAQRSGGHIGRVGRGIGFARYKNLGAYLAVIAEVNVNSGATGTVRLQRAFAAVDVGQVVNPDGLRNQIEGGIVQAASWTLKERVTYSREGTSSIDWATYPILRFDEVPEIDIEIIDRPRVRFVGAGEAAHGPVAAAIANAVAAATGLRLRDLPLTPDKVLAASTRA